MTQVGGRAPLDAIPWSDRLPLMTTARVLSAAAALRDFDLDQVAAFCDEPTSVIRSVLAEASDCFVRVGAESDPVAGSRPG